MILDVLKPKNRILIARVAVFRTSLNNVMVEAAGIEPLSSPSTSSR